MRETSEPDNTEYIAVPAWDVPTRILHWLNALTVLGLAIFALTIWGVESLKLPDDITENLTGLLKKVHTYAGYSLTVTYTLRVIWGFAGNKYARFSDMISFKKEHWSAIIDNIKWYLSGFKGHPPVAIGHNPLASLFYLPLFAVLTMQVISGIILAGLEYDAFPGTILRTAFGIEGADKWGTAAEGIHIFGLYFIGFFFCAHMVGLVVHEIGERCGLFSSMIHGRKYVEKEKGVRWE